MPGRSKITAIVGTYRKGGAIDSAVDEILAGAQDAGAEVTIVRLIDKHIEFCTNCRACTQQEGPTRGDCPIKDDMGAILDQIEQSDGLVLASPMNFGSVTAVTKRFIERLVCYAYWPWGTGAPQVRNTEKRRRAVIVASSAAPSLIARFLTPMAGQMKKVVRLLGARKVDLLFVGLSAMQPHHDLAARVQTQGRHLGRKLATHHACD